MAQDLNVDRSTRMKLVGLLVSLQQVQAELSLPQLVALIQIAVESGLSVSELADRLQCPQQTASRHVAALLGRYQGTFDSNVAEAAGRAKLDPLITQEISKTDPRRRALFVSDFGRALLVTMISSLDTR